MEGYTALLERDREERNKLNDASENSETGGTKRDSNGIKTLTKRQGNEKRKAAKNVEENKENVHQPGGPAKRKREFQEPVKVKIEEKEMVMEEENGNNEKEKPEGGSKSTPKKLWNPVYLTSREVEGLLMVIDRMRKWPKTNVPDTIQKPDELLDRLQVILFLSCNAVYVYDLRLVV